MVGNWKKGEEEEREVIDTTVSREQLNLELYA